MNTNTVLKFAAVAAPLAVVAYAALSKNATLEHLYAKYPDLDPKIAKSVYRSMMSDALRGKLDMSGWNEDAFDAAFKLRYTFASTPKFEMKK